MEVSIFEWTDFFFFHALKIDVVWSFRKFKGLEDLKEVILKYDKSKKNPIIHYCCCYSQKRYR